MPILRNTLIIDTGFLVALLSTRDHFHKKALSMRPRIEDKAWITTWCVITEACHLLQSIAPNLAPALISLCQQQHLNLFDLRSEHFVRIKTLMAKYQELPMDLADASLVILAEELGHGEILSTDNRDFKTYRFKNHSPFRNLFV